MRFVLLVSWPLLVLSVIFFWPIQGKCSAGETSPLTDAALHFEEQIRPILAAKCIKCHGADKDKGDLRIHTVGWILTGGENGEIVVPGNSKKSLFYTLTTLDDDDDDVMPSKGKLLTPEQQNVFKRWIDEGLLINELKSPGPAVNRWPEEDRSKRAQ